MLKIITGQPRHGKSQYTVYDEILRRIEENDKREKEGKHRRKIYCDFAGINDDDTPTKLPEVLNPWNEFNFTKQNSKWWFGEIDDPDKPDDYVIPEEGSVFIFDECHKIDWVKDTTGALSKHPTAISMNEHGHRDFIIVLVTQFPSYIHTHLRGLTEEHYHVKRFQGLKMATVYKWNEFKVNPRAKSSIADIYEKETFKFNKKYQDCYKSASAHDSMKFKLPKEWARMFLFIGAIFCIFAYVAKDSPLGRYLMGTNSSMFTHDENSKNQQEKQSITIPNSTIQDTKTVYEHDPRHVQLLEQYKKQVELQQAIIAEHEIKIANQVIQLQQVRLHSTYLAEQQDGRIRVGGIIRNNKKCQSYNIHGDKLNMKRDECDSYIDENKIQKSRLLNNKIESDTLDTDNNIQVQEVKPL